MPKLTQDEFLRRAHVLHGRRYDYSKTIYRGTNYKVTIVCRKHGPFKQWGHTHIEGNGCRACQYDGMRIGIARFLKHARATHGLRYNYSKVRYKRNDIKVKIICRKHGVFEQRPDSHFSGSACPRCKSSYGEAVVAQALLGLKIQFLRQAKLITGRQNSFDFLLPEQKVLIEYNGEQHYLPVAPWGGRARLRVYKQSDAMKRTWAHRNGYRLIVIPYTVRNIEGYLRKKLAARQTAEKFRGLATKQTPDRRVYADPQATAASGASGTARTKTRTTT
jgi:very-short-patch-repair endonuclease